MHRALDGPCLDASASAVGAVPCCARKADKEGSKHRRWLLRGDAARCRAASLHVPTPYQEVDRRRSRVREHERGESTHVYRRTWPLSPVSLCLLWHCTSLPRSL